jgi:hypothetical protein
MIGITKQLNQFKSFLYLKPQYIAHNIKFYLKICVTNICKHEFLKSYSINNTIITKTKNLIQKSGQNISTDISPEETYRWLNKHMKRYSILLIIREMHIKLQ